MKHYGIQILWLVAAQIIVSSFAVQAERYIPSPPVYPAPMGGMIDGEWNDAYTKARAFVANLTLLEKVNITSGTGWQMGPCVGNTGSIPRLGFPSLCLQDSPTGIRYTDLNTVFPAGLATGATFNKDLMYLRAKAMAQENKAKGINVLLGPCMGPIGRAPEGGRNWEAFGSDPYLQGVAAYQSVIGIQEEGVIATSKHFIANEQEHFRQHQEWVAQGFTNLSEPYSSNVDERALREIYAWPFADAIRAGTASVMCSYNQVNQSQACQNSYLMNGILKDELGFQGFVMSDWNGQRSGVASVLAGLDMSMPGDGLGWADGIPYLGSNLTIAVLNGSVPIWRLDDMATRVMAAYFKVGQDPKTYPVPNFSSFTLATHGPIYPGTTESPSGKVNYHVNARGDLSREIVRAVAQESIVLVKNTKNALPLSGITKLGLFGSAAGPSPLGPNGCPERGCANGTIGIGWGSGTSNFPYIMSAVEAMGIEAINRGMTFEYVLDDYDLTTAETLAATIDTAIVFISADSGEGFMVVEGNHGDRNDLYAFHSGDDLVAAVAAQNENTIVVIESVGAIDMESWIENGNVTAVLYAITGGQDVGFAINDVLFGNISPSGKLPFTIAKHRKDYPVDVMYKVEQPVPQLNFTEEIFIDYRHFDKYKIKPRYEFGYGLSYTTFNISTISVTTATGAATDEAPALPPPYSAVVITNETLPHAKSAVYPADIPRYPKYVYPYITKSTAHSIKYDRSSYPYPKGYSEEQPTLPSIVGGGSGGNPALWEVLAVVEVTVANTGSVLGAEVVQLYIAYPEVKGVEFPVKTLRGFEKVSVAPGQSATVSLNLLRRDLSYYDVARRNWLLPRGRYTVLIGNSSRNITEAGSFSF
ncbi:glycosyl hydrolase family 3 N terminal domain-containing protein [Lipomyces arxii]|uniref:glycosyl hydrolase family 3 N terminal domain-containing protein n=1 Tax=Lipomyces arxii TaxID=56418 RepID=UPI0034CE243B